MTMTQKLTVRVSIKFTPPDSIEDGRLIDSHGTSKQQLIATERDGNCCSAMPRIMLSELSGFKSDLESNPVGSAFRWQSLSPVAGCHLSAAADYTLAVRNDNRDWYYLDHDRIFWAILCLSHAAFRRGRLEAFRGDFPTDVAADSTRRLCWFSSVLDRTGTILSASLTTLARRAACRRVATELPRTGGATGVCGFLKIWIS